MRNNPKATPVSKAVAEWLNQLQDVFAGGTAGLGAAINDMMNAFSDVVTAPTDLSARNLADHEVVEHLAGALARHGLPPESLIVEITESALMDDPETAIEVVNAIAAHHQEVEYACLEAPIVQAADAVSAAEWIPGSPSEASILNSRGSTSCRR